VTIISSNPFTAGKFVKFPTTNITHHTYNVFPRHLEKLKIMLKFVAFFAYCVSIKKEATKLITS